MAGGKDLGLHNKSGCSLKEQLAKKTLYNVRKQGHTYVDLREDGKRFVFFCTLCLSPCYSDSILFDHLNGNLHSERLAAAKVTLLKPNPWPFNDGVLFFHDPEQDKLSLDSTCDQTKVIGIDWNDDDDALAIVKFNETSMPEISEDAGDADSKNSTPTRTEGQHQIVIPSVLCRDKISEVVVTHIGIGKIGARVSEKDGVSNEVRRIWCEWLGDKDSCDEGDIMVPVHDFALVIFSYNNSLGRQSLLEELRGLLPSSYHFESDQTDNAKTRKRKSFSDPEDVSDSMNNQACSSSDDSESSSSRLLLQGCDDHSVHSRAISNKTLLRQLRKKHEVASVRVCGICQQKLLPGKDVATLMNMNTGKLACSSRNMTGAFHVYHISCLIHWVLLCELEMHSDGPKWRKKSNKHDHNGERKSGGMQIHIPSIFCPECQGTGMMISEDNLEKPTISLSQIYKFKIKLTGAREEWIRSPETLSNCSTGFTFPPLSNEEVVTSLKLLHFYRMEG